MPDMKPFLYTSRLTLRQTSASAIPTFLTAAIERTLSLRPKPTPTSQWSQTHPD